MRTCDVCGVGFEPRAANHRLCGSIACRRRAKRDRQVRNPNVEYQPRQVYLVDGEGRECTHCRNYQPWGEFYEVPRNKTGHASRCKTCVRSGQAGRYLSARADAESAERMRVQRRAYKYGVTVDAIMQMEAVTECSICGGTLTSKTRVIDHCHETDRVRGVLCKPCNLAIGILGDNQESLMRAVRYLARAEQGDENERAN